MKKIIIAALVILALVLGASVLFSRQSAGVPVSGIQDSGVPESAANDPGGAEEAQAPDTAGGVNNAGDAAGTTVTTVVYTPGGFSPSEVSVEPGSTVRFVNESGGTMWVASAVHPAHAAYDGTSLAKHCAQGAAPSFDQCRSGGEYSFTFEKAGTWKYHDHLHASKTGTIIVR